MSDKTIHIDNHDSEADTCRKEVLPKLYDSQWSDDLILEQRTFTDGKIIVIGRNKTLGLDKLMKILVPVPSIELQREFVELLNKTNAVKEHHKQTEQELTKLIPSLLDKAFKGEL